MLDLSVKRIEGLGENLSYAGCYITVEGELIDVITPLTLNSLESSIRIPSTGKLHLIIKNMRDGDKMIGSVSFPISILINPVQWLPLFDNLEYDSLPSIPEKVDYPRIQLAVAPVASEHSLAFVDKIKSLQLKIINLEHTLASERWEFQREIGSLSSSQRYREDSQALVIEQLKAQIEKQETLIQDLINKKENAKNSFEEDIEWKRNLEEKYKNQFVEIEAVIKKSQERDKEYVKTISKLNRENLEIKYKIDLVSNEIFEKELKISHLSEKICHLALENYESLIHNLKEKIVVLQNHLSESEQSRGSMQCNLERLVDKIELWNPCNNCGKLNNQIVGLKNQISSMKSELKEYENRISENRANFSYIPDLDIFSEPPIIDKNSDLSSKVLQLMLENKSLKHQKYNAESSAEQGDEVDEALKAYPEFFAKISSGQYFYNNIGINIFLEQGVLVCRVGNTMLLHEFILSFNQGSNSTTPGDNSFKENPKVMQEVASEIGECSFTSEEDKKEELKKKDSKQKKSIIKKQYRPDNKVFAPLRQSSTHMERKSLVK